jgi:hypothetical protein
MELSIALRATRFLSGEGLTPADTQPSGMAKAKSSRSTTCRSETTRPNTGTAAIAKSVKEVTAFGSSRSPKFQDSHSKASVYQGDARDQRWWLGLRSFRSFPEAHKDSLSMRVDPSESVVTGSNSPGKRAGDSSGIYSIRLTSCISVPL